jgi:signal transduction histidine kinase
MQKATRLDKDFIIEKNKLIIILEDDGIGFEQKEIRKQAGLGLKSLQSRTQLMNGRCIAKVKKMEPDLYLKYLIHEIICTD